MIIVSAIVLGLMTGSFLNMLIHRLPRGIKLISPARSFCPFCKKTIPLKENIPLVSFILLKGKCSGCKAKISWQYPIVEMITSIVSVAFCLSAISKGDPAEYFFKFTVFCAFLIHVIVDLKHKILPDFVSLYLGLIFLFHSIWHYSWIHWLGGAIVGGGLPALVSFCFYRIKKEEGLGGGDIKLFFVLGIILGIPGIVLNIFLSCLLGSIICLGLIFIKKMNKKETIPFGPFIVLVASFQIFFPSVFLQFMEYTRLN